ncbi:GTP-binding protein [Entomophthora muscae]|uniref:GTP-binding protein n=1 Tax=Entomophthora muscae TaxID=34485 RepID=A0ACC2TB03_9FUNG|nr:GTP-binding protein [Entomophthora muscae]
MPENSNTIAPTQQSSNSLLRRIAVLGSRAVGKSSLTIQFVEKSFRREYSVEITDTAGQDEFSILSSQHAVGIHGYVLVYSITSRASFEIVKVIREKILNFTGTEWAPMIIVGNKRDLHQQRQISAEEGKELALQWKCQFIESSAKNNENIGQAFEIMIHEVEKSLSNPSEEKRNA